MFIDLACSLGPGITGRLAMQQNPPPFKRFARERFDGASLQNERPASVTNNTHGGPSRISLDEPQHSRQQTGPPSTLQVDQYHTEHYWAPSPLTGIWPQHTPLQDSRPNEPLRDSYIVSPLGPDVPYPWRLRAPPVERTLSTPTVSQRRQHGAYRSGNDPRSSEASASPMQLPPQPQLRPYSIANDLVPHSVSQPNTPSCYPYTQQQDLDEPPPSITTGESSTQLGSGRRRPRSATGMGDANFTNDEFHLFVQATAGLGPDLGTEQSFRTPNLPYNMPDREESYHGAGYTPRNDLSMMILEPDTVTATRAYQAATTPHGRTTEQQEFAPSRPPMQRLETSSSALDLWLQPPSAAPLDDDYTVSPIEDELPDYATSQAQAQAEQRIEAARRAKELRRRWEESRH
ncbi:uncharacterized protein RCC_02845 [Ramularia collo-cygni]|uniref:Uncharacterized protein n=1 Tax=Ramularia collo-cygni TaxID=112498 RepID=A0A2D3V9C4_9PEZI|nr:uncharacterized protein RCC_02845 [Ramularia collo-cygni]CZT17013.1 uncharacterized protein RCC_02845 [Ramularia collo-cygni]